VSDDSNDPYRAPAADHVSPAGASVAGGSIEGTLAGQAELVLGDVFREAWAKTDGVTLILAGGFLLLALVNGAAQGLIAVLFGDGLLSYPVTQIVNTLITAPFMAGAFMLALRRSLEQPVAFDQLFDYYGSMLVPIFILALITSVATSIGFVLLVLPGIYLSVALSLALPLKVEKGMSTVDCLSTSIRLVNAEFLTVFAMAILAGLAIMLGFVTIIGWIWTVPLAVMVFAITYRQLAGVALD